MGSRLCLPLNLDNSISKYSTTWLRLARKSVFTNFSAFILRPYWIRRHSCSSAYAGSLKQFKHSETNQLNKFQALSPYCIGFSLLRAPLLRSISQSSRSLANFLTKYFCFFRTYNTFLRTGSGASVFLYATYPRYSASKPIEYPPPTAPYPRHWLNRSPSSQKQAIYSSLFFK